MLIRDKSTLQNEILSNLKLEFTAVPEKDKELPLDKLSSLFGSGYLGQLGKHMTSLILVEGCLVISTSHVNQQSSKRKVKILEEKVG